MNKWHKQQKCDVMLTRTDGDLLPINAESRLNCWWLQIWMELNVLFVSGFYWLFWLFGSVHSSLFQWLSSGRRASRVGVRGCSGGRGEKEDTLIEDVFCSRLKRGLQITQGLWGRAKALPLHTYANLTTKKNGVLEVKLGCLLLLVLSIVTPIVTPWKSKCLKGGEKEKETGFWRRIWK